MLFITLRTFANFFTLGRIFPYLDDPCYAVLSHEALIGPVQLVGRNQLVDGQRNKVYAAPNVLTRTPDVAPDRYRQVLVMSAVAGSWALSVQEVVKGLLKAPVWEREGDLLSEPQRLNLVDEGVVVVQRRQRQVLSVFQHCVEAL